MDGSNYAAGFTKLMSLPHAERKEELRRFIRGNCIEERPVTLHSGKRSDRYIDVRIANLNHRSSALIGSLVLDIINQTSTLPPIEHVGGMATSSIPMAAIAAGLSSFAGRPLDAFYIRERPKGYGKNNGIEGLLRRGRKVAIVDDVSTSGDSMISAINAVREFGAVPAIGILVVNRGGAEAVYGKTGVRCISLLQESDLVKR